MNHVFNNTDNAAGEMLTYMDNLRDRETKKHIGELLIKRNNLFTNTVMDYMIHNDRGTDINKVYNKVKQKNINTNKECLCRKIVMNIQTMFRLLLQFQQHTKNQNYVRMILV